MVKRLDNLIVPAYVTVQLSCLFACEGWFLKEEMHSATYSNLNPHEHTYTPPIRPPTYTDPLEEAHHTEGAH